MKRRFLAILTLLVAAGFTGCDDSSAGPKTTNPKVEGTAPPAPEKSKLKAPEPASNKLRD